MSLVLQIQLLWLSPSNTILLPAFNDIVDPDGSNGATIVTTFESLIAKLED